MTYAIVDQDGIVVNIALWDGQSEWRPGPGLTAVLAEGAEVQIGWIHDNGSFYPPSP